MERSGMWGYKDDVGNGVLQGRPNMYCIVNHCLQFISSLQDFPAGTSPLLRTAK
ncbi:hypothetical protein Barb7_03146 [Bacteroidales bacterium Barb7]|nr:hypothetical protein Barb7_03146 [Bacteroidales bacterium Barb7]